MIGANKKNDIDLIRRAAEGESSAFGLLYDKYHPAIYRFVYLKVSHREEAEDITHHVFLNAWQNIDTFEDQGLPITSWLYKIAHNKVVDYYRTRRFTANIDEIPEEILNITQGDGQEQAGQRIAIEKVFEALRSLPEDQQNVVIMRFVEELPHKNIAQVLGKSEGTIRVLQHRAIKSLQHILKDYEA